MLLNTKKINEKQFALVEAMVKHFGGANVLSRTQLRAGFAAVVEGRKGSPYFISKNEAAKFRIKGKIVRGLYNLSIFYPKGAVPEVKVHADAKIPEVKKEAKGTGGGGGKKVKTVTAPTVDENGVETAAAEPKSAKKSKAKVAQPKGLSMTPDAIRKRAKAAAKKSAGNAAMDEIPLMPPPTSEEPYTGAEAV